MKVYLLDQHTKTVDMWKLYFGEYKEVVPVCDDFAHFMDNTEIECVVSPANSYGLMDGGYDLAIQEFMDDRKYKIPEGEEQIDMCKAIEDMKDDARNEGSLQRANDMALKMLKKNEPIEKIVEYTSLSDQQVQELAQQMR